MASYRENVLYGPLSEHFVGQGFFVVSGARKQNIKGTDEFGVKIEGREKWVTVDILGVRWRENGQVHSVAVECKLHGTAWESAGASLNQVTDYQVFFDEVYVATQEGDLKHKESVLRELGVGHMVVNLHTNKVRTLLPAQPRNASRFEPLQNATQVVPRVVMPLVFQDRFGLSPRYMHTRSGGLWVAVDVIPHSQVQYNAGGINGRTRLGINVEFIDDLRSIIRAVDRAKLASCLRALSNEHRLTLGIDELRTDRRLSKPVDGRANEVDVNYLLKQIEKEVRLKTGVRRRSKPHLTISCLLYEWNEQLSKRDYQARVEEAVHAYTPLMEVLRECF